MPILTTKNYKDFTLIDTSTSEVLVSFSAFPRANKCLPGDEVEWDGECCKLIQRANYGPIVGTLELNSKYQYGFTSRGHKIYLFHPMNTSFPIMRVGCSEKDTSLNKLALVDFADWEPCEQKPRGALLRLLGNVGDSDAERAALQWRYGLPALQKVKLDVPLETIMSANVTRPLVEGITINIDPQGCRDVDDVVTLKQLDEFRWSLVITISDVAEFLPPKSLGDTLARQKGQTLYQGGSAVLPMLPTALSEDSLSLLAGKERLGISLFCIWNESLEELEVRGFQPTRIYNNKTYTYESILQAKDFPIGILECVASSLKGMYTSDPHQWIEELMLLYNREVAKCLVAARAGLLRTHAPADAAKYAAYAQIHSDLVALAYEAAIYEPAMTEKTHSGVGDVVYTHATSPLRRYADLYNQRILKAYVAKSETPSTSTPTEETKTAKILNERNKNHKQHDRYYLFLENILQYPIGKKSAIVVEDTTTKTKVYVPIWKQLVSLRKTEECKETYQPGAYVLLEYYSQMNQPNWKQRIVFRIRS